MRWIALHACSIEPAAMTPEEVQLAICAVSLSFTPRVALCGSAVVMEVSGSLRLFGGLHKLAALLEAKIHAFFKQNSLNFPNRYIFRRCVF